ncbi:gamma-glutamyltranspeptidase/glutathione hydrolase [Sphingobium sp. B2D3A]|uniref:gamma-glutamyltransferase n=1 Tax=unclassified Sphingobium TaxID=2611147 RepID=UPI002224271C|nr:MULTISPECIES: gamma-glutamyltransferase [unclassified Sphingobium]MCW2339023.1 gamma-glutamyltranspeptidase/glutathione hydrolase [Sphingobium sp. B2D3A]MCW2385448.1 gamma-glutamyltranspeptidase/glutathione hydrolase [Sphingobium sp. B2D3D]
MFHFRAAIGFLSALALTACATTAPPRSSTAPRPASPVAQNFVVASNPLAAEAGMKILRQGGSAVDAAIAVQAMLSLVEPQSSGMGGGAFMTFFDGGTGKVVVYDGRETAPAGATPDMFLGADGKPMPFRDALVSGRATGVPGAVRMLALAHDEHGSLPWKSLFGDAERTARTGFTITPRLAKFLEGNFPQMQVADARRYFSAPDGSIKKAGDQLANPAYADFLERLAAQGPSALYAGDTAQRIVTRVTAGPLSSSMTLADLAAYRPIKREAVCNPYRVYVVCVPPPPSSGVAFLQLLSLLERTDIDKRGPADPQAWFQFAEASRLMYADRDRYVGDPAFTAVPVAGLLDSVYVDSRAKLIGATAGPPPSAGVPPGAQIAGIDDTHEPGGTSHFIVGDARGNVVSITTTVESIFGTGRMVDGFFLNNQLTDFSFTPQDADGRPAANAVAPGKRPRSSMIPLVMIDRAGHFAGAIGSAGGNAILAYVGKSLVAAVDWGLPMQEALALPNLIARGSAFQGEVSKFSPDTLAGLKARGIDLRPGQGEDSGVHAVIIRNGVVDGGYDPRREGRVLVEAAIPQVDR